MKLITIIIFLIFSKVANCQDTLKVVMLYSDTSIVDLIAIDEKSGEEYEEMGFDEYTYWRRGFKVGDYYLDADKKRIPTTNVVWFTKIIK